ncbi:MAG: PASTA domain-containing protein [Clostridia bacterium]|nr:PASTA domain-containing protein [Clostridia bacterium]
MRTLSKDPSARYRTAERMKRALLNALKKRDYIPADSSLDLLADESDSSDPRPVSIHTIPPIAKIAIVVALFIVAFTGMFFGIRYIYATSEEPSNVVPSLVGKKLQDAQNRAEDFGFTVDIEEYESSSDPAGTVLTQSPDAGKHAKPGSSITIKVSAGPEVPVVPYLIGLTYEEAISAIENAGFKLGTVSYQVSDTAIGYVCYQSIPAGMESTEGTEVSISISATATSTFVMPSVILFPLSEAVKLLDSTDSVKIRIAYDMTADKSLNGTVILQQPIAGEEVQTGRTVTLTVAGPQPSGYSADVAYNVDISDSGTPVIGAIEDAISGVLVERVLYSNILEPGEKIPVSFTATVSVSGRYEVVLYINGVEVKRQEVNFTDEAVQP